MIEENVTKGREKKTVPKIEKKMNPMNNINDDKLPSRDKRNINSTFLMKLTKFKHKKRQRRKDLRLTHFKCSEYRK